MRPSILPLLLGWMLSMWVPVPEFVRMTAHTLTAAACNGVAAVVHTIHPTR